VDRARGPAALPCQGRRAATAPASSSRPSRRSPPRRRGSVRGFTNFWTSNEQPSAACRP
jgi:hypothetical protein